jgi:hypothetical protein
MLYLLLVVFTFNQGDSLSAIPVPVRKSYTSQVTINGIIGLGFGVGTSAFYFMGDKAYEHYRDSGSMKNANAYYNKAMTYDYARDLCAVGAIFFLARALYYQLKNARAKTVQGYKPSFDFNTVGFSKVKFGLKTGI